MANLNMYRAELQELEARGNLRKLPPPAGALVDLSSNDYLGLNQNPALYNRFLEEVPLESRKPSAASSRLLSGNTQAHIELEQTIGELYGNEALIYNSGYHANTGILPALAGKNDLILADKLVHASLIDGMKLSQATTLRFAHLNYAHLESLLEQNRGKFEQVFIVSESIFSMDGDVADLEKLIELKQKFDTFLYLDEAHSVGLLGKQGLGISEEKNCLKEVDFLVGCMGKSLASIGAFLVCNEVFKSYLINRSRTLIFSTALPPINLAWSKFVFELLPSLNLERQRLQSLTQQFSTELGQVADSHIIPFLVGENDAAVRLSQQLQQLGFKVLPIRYPTVPKGTARLRFSLNANMNFDSLLPIIQHLKKHGQTLAQ
ncbi:8-amino-7-oxononanoate synthase [Flammeovirgaceae bacterium SG7u.111]|nr:8-amino-7-oxononanoate synthase [Flammeovirgaceae bacterium SG7u.132]WPO36464.1 8-amino-7-oxononanoate synthase [Flammeovirgaceae bacterium SG7u.111]